MPATQLLFLGTGNAFNEDARGSAALVLQLDDGSALLVDAGPTVLQAMARARFAAARIDRLFVTHLHGDHIAGWPFLLLELVFRARRTAPLHVHGPVGTRSALETLSHVCYGEVETRREFDIVYDEIPIDPFRHRAAGPHVTFDGVPMEHHPTSLGYRFDLPCGGTRRRVAVTGDTRWCDGLEELARGSDLLVAECTSVSRVEQPHLSLDEIRAARERLATPRVALVHLNDAVSERLALDPIRGVIPTHDGLTLDL
jgi:ribonuclease BN (tRNA processing enzyme)